MKIQGFWDRVDEVCAEDGRQKHEIVKAMGGANRKILYEGEQRNHMLSAFHLARFCAVTGASADYLLGLKRKEVRD